MIESNAAGERVPLYLSGRATAQALSRILPTGPVRFIDLGCGPGGLLARLSRAHPEVCFEGVESAPLPWLAARLRLVRRRHCRVQWGDLWALPLEEYDVVYCFLSPAPMARLWAKACAELRPGALFISNTFTLPDAPPPAQVVEVIGGSGPLYVWRM